MTADHIQAIFWSITYILLIIHSLKYKTHGIPITAIFLNFAWETVALCYSLHSGQISAPLLIRLAWTSLDFVMVVLFLVYETKFCENKKEKRYFFWGYFISLCFCVILFREGYMLL